jgi:Fuc2NAc and GlcNAc transferase
LIEPHRKHVYQLLANECSFSHWKVSLGYGALQAVVGIGALVNRGYGMLAVLGFLGACLIGFWCFGYRVRTRVKAEACPAPYLAG